VIERGGFHWLYSQVKRRVFACNDLIGYRNAYDALSIVVIDMPNDGTPVALIKTPPAPQPGDIYHYDTMIARLSGIYATRFKDLA
jgi:hypothetical protein